MQWFLEGGPTMYLILGTDVMLLCGGALVLLTAIAARFFQPMLWPARVLAMLLLFATGLPVIEGIIGWWLGMQNVQQAIEHASPEMRETLLAAGTYYARIPLWFGLISTIVMGSGALVSVVIAAIPGRAAEP